MSVVWFTTAILALAGADAKDPEEPVSAWQEYFRGQVDEYDLTLRTQDDVRTLEPKANPVLRWTQPVRGGDDGAVYLWLDGDRPAAIASILAWPHPDGYHVVQHEWHSLADAPLTAAFKGTDRWKPTTAGVEWKPLSAAAAAAPAAAAAARLRQMRSLARRFSGHSVDDLSGDQRWDMRLLAQPLHTFDVGDGAAGEGRQDGPAAGALFALVQGTDPEILVMIEATTGGTPGWRYALARLSDRPLEVELDGETVWKVDRDPLDRIASPYTTLRIEDRRPPVANEATDGD